MSGRSAWCGAVIKDSSFIKSSAAKIGHGRIIMIEPGDLRGLEFFDDLTDNELEVISEIVNKKDFTTGETVFKENVVGSSLYIIKKGEVKVCKEGPGGELVTITLLKDEDIFGEMSFLDERTHSSSIVAVSDVETYVIEKADFDKLVDAHPRVVYKLMKNIVFTVHAIVKGMNLRYIDMMNYMWGRQR